MTISKRTVIISASGATLILIVGIAAFIWIRMMEIPSELNIAAKQDKQSVGMTKSSKTPQTTVIRKKLPPAPPKIVETVSPVPEVKPTVSEPQTETAKEVVSTDIKPVTEKLAKAEIPPPTPKTEPEPVKTSDAEPAPAPAPEPAPQKPEKVEPPQPPKDFSYSMQVGAFLVKKNAAERILILEQMGQKPYSFDTTDEKGTQWHTVRIGQYNAPEEARKDLKEFRKTSPFKAVIIKKDSLSPLKKKK